MKTENTVRNEITTLPPFITWKEMKKRIPYSRAHIWRLERKGLFPQRVKLGANRTVWVREEIEGWEKAAINNRKSTKH